jgi:hypothetical protein
MSKRVVCLAGELTVVEMTHFHHSRTQTKEQHAILLVLRAELADNNVQGGFGGSVQRAVFQVEFVDQFEVCVAAGYGNNFLDGSFQHKWHEEVEKVDVADNVGRP